MISHLTEQKISEMKEAFGIFDTDDDGYLSERELINLYGKLGFSISEQDIKEIILSVDKEGKGKISFKDFVEVSMSIGTYKDEELRDIFKIFDKEGKGTITRNNLKQVFRDIGEKVTDQGLQELYTLANVKSDFISFEDFRRIMTL